MHAPTHSPTPRFFPEFSPAFLPFRFYRPFLARDAFVRTNPRAIAMTFVRPSVCLSGTGVQCIVICDYTVHFSADLSLWLDRPMFWAPKHVHLLPTVFSTSTWKRSGVWVCKQGEALNANNDKYVIYVGEFNARMLYTGLSVDYRLRLWAPHVLSLRSELLVLFLLPSCLMPGYNVSPSFS